MENIITKLLITFSCMYICSVRVFVNKLDELLLCVVSYRVNMLSKCFAVIILLSHQVIVTFTQSM